MRSRQVGKRAMPEKVMKDVGLNSTVAIMNSTPDVNSAFGKRQRIRGMMVACAVGALILASPSVRAQNAAQRAALGRLRSVARPAVSQPNGVEATAVPLVLPYQIAFDSAGNIYIADTGDYLIREINVAGVISTVAGSGTQGFGGDAGAAASALLDTPTGVAVDASGNIYIADTNNNRIREVSGGIITTIAGTGAPGYSGDGGSALSATLNSPGALAIDSSGNLYVADSNNDCIRKISGGSISTVAGDGFEGFAGDGGPATSAMLDTPLGVAVDAAGNIFIGDTNNQRVRMVSAKSGIITTVAGTGAHAFTSDGSALAVPLASPSGVAVDASGTVYIADSDNQRIRTLSGGQITTIAGGGVQGYSGDTGSATAASIDTPRAVIPGNSEVLFSDTNNNRVRLISNSTLNTVGGTTQSGAESVQIAGALSGVYGSGTLTATFSNNGNIGSGLVTLYDGVGAAPVVIGQAKLSSNAATIGVTHLSAGTHSIVASYAGDAQNQPVTSGVFVYVVTQAPLTATPNAVHLLYGQAIPALTGALSGILPQDSGNVTAVYTTTATATSAPASYPIAVALTGSAAANYKVALANPTASVAIAQAPSSTTLTASNSSPILGTSLTLTATVASTTTGTPTGTVNFYNGSTLLNAAPVPVNGGVATLALASLPVGAQSITAVYSGNADFIASNSNALAEVVLSPDFTINSSPSTQTVLPLQSVSYGITVTPVNATFVYPVTFTVSGLPPGVTATFNPSSIAAGSSGATTTLTLNAGSQAQLHKNQIPFKGLPNSTALAFLFLPLIFSSKTRKAALRLSRASNLTIALLALAALTVLSGCGGGGFFGHSTQTYTVTVTAASGPDTHTTSVNVTVQ